MLVIMYHRERNVHLLCFDHSIKNSEVRGGYGGKVQREAGLIYINRRLFRVLDLPSGRLCCVTGPTDPDSSHQRGHPFMTCQRSSDIPVTFLGCPAQTSWLDLYLN